MSCLSNENPYITFSEAFFSRHLFSCPICMLSILSFFSSIMQNSSFGCITGFHSNKQSLSHNSDCFTKQYEPHQCCNAVSHHRVFDKASLEKLPSEWAGKSWLPTILSDWSYSPTHRIIEIQLDETSSYHLLNHSSVSAQIFFSCMISLFVFYVWDQYLEQQQNQQTLINY